MPPCLAAYLRTGDAEIIGIGREVTGLRRDGSTFPMRLSVGEATPAADQRLFTGIVRDLTENQRTRTELLDAEARMRAIVETAVDGIIAIAGDGTIEAFNPGAERIFGWPAEAVVGRNVRMLMPQPYSDEHDSYLHAYLHTGVARIIGIGRDVTGLRRDGSTFPMHLSVGEAAVTGRRLFTGVVRDITDLVEAEHTMARLAAADAASKAKSEFLSRLSHELRTPLNVILGFAQILQHEQLESSQRESTDYIYRAGRHLLQLIDEALDIASIEAGRLRLSIEGVDVQEVVAEVLDLMRPLASQRSVTLAADMSSFVISGDRQRLKQVLLNLVSNAIKYNQEDGRVSIAGERRGSRRRVNVRDSGPGISAAELPLLFVPFERLTITARVEGTGLGLVLCRQLIEAMQGEMGIDSVMGEGTTAWFELNLAFSAFPGANLEVARSGGLVPSSDLGGRRFLYVEDNLTSFRFVERLIEQRWPKVTLLPAALGSLGLDLARTHHPDLILLDLNLPDMHGTHILALLKRFEETRDIPVIIISADVTLSSAEAFRNAGAHAFLPKPLDADVLQETLERLFGAGAPG